jgi:hypothetical protein
LIKSRPKYPTDLYGTIYIDNIQKAVEISLFPLTLTYTTPTERHIIPRVSGGTTYVIHPGICYAGSNIKRKYCWWRNLQKTTDMSQVTDKRYRILLYRVHLAWAGFELTALVVIGTDCTSSFKANYQTITPTTAPFFVIKSFARYSWNIVKNGVKHHNPFQKHYYNPK